MARVVVAPLEAIAGILATRHFLTISEESLPEQVTIVPGKIHTMFQSITYYLVKSVVSAYIFYYADFAVRPEKSATICMPPVLA